MNLIYTVCPKFSLMFLLCLENDQQLGNRKVLSETEYYYKT